jgi:hypothetical protein
MIIYHYLQNRRDAMTLVDVSFKVPEEIVPEFYEHGGKLIQQLLRGRVGSESSDRSAPENWTPERALGIYRSSSAKGRQLLDYWIDHPGEPATGNQIAEHLGWSNDRAVASSLKTIIYRGSDFDRLDPFHWESADGNAGHYWMTPAVADVFRRARERYRGA